MEYRELGQTGMKISIIGYGASPLGNVFGPTDEVEGIRAVHHAIDHGINYFDVAPMYGVTLAESRLGKAIKGKRDKIYLATKCCRYDEDVFDFSARRVKNSIDESLKRLQTDYVDVYQIHDIEFGYRDQILDETIPAANQVVASGKARFVGLTGLPVRYLAAVLRLADSVDTLLSWGHYNLVEDEIDDELVPLCKEKGIGLMSASPLHQRLLTEKGPPSWHRSPKQVLQVASQIASLCKSHGVDIADVAMRFALDHSDIATTIVGMSKQKHVENNLKVLTARNDPELLERIQTLAAPIKNLMWFEGRPENNLPNAKNERPVCLRAIAEIPRTSHSVPAKKSLEKK